MLAHYEVPVAGPRRGHRGPGADARPAAVVAAVAQGAGRQRGGDGRPHRRPGLGPTTPGTADIVVGAAGVPSMITPDVIRPGAVRGRRAASPGRGARLLLRRGRVLRRGGRLDHPPARRSRRHHRGHAAAQHRGRGRAPRSPRATCSATQPAEGVGGLALAGMAKIADLLAAGRTFSFEFFPPKNDAEQATSGPDPAGAAAAAAVVRLGHLPGRSGRRGGGPTTWSPACSRTTTLTPMAHLICVGPHPPRAGRDPGRPPQGGRREPDGARR